MEGNSLEEKIKNIAKSFLEKTKEKEIQVISHFDTDGITSAAIITKALKKLDKHFSVKIVKNLEEQFIYDLSKEKITLFLDLASGSLNHIKKSNLKNVFIIDHHEIIQEIPEEIEMLNPQLHEKQKMSSSCLAYLFSKELDPQNKNLAKLGILGMIGDMLEKEIEKLNNGILEDGEIKRLRGVTIYPSTRPLNRTLEFCSNPYIPGVTGNPQGVFELLREVGLKPEKSKYKSLVELDEEEMEKLVTAILLRNPKTNNREIIGEIFLLKMFNKLEDARELSAKINACSRFGESNIALQFCLETPNAKKRAESIHAKYRQLLISGIKFASETEKIEGKKFVIINAKDNIRETMIGTISSILSNSPSYESGTIIIGMAYYESNFEKRIKVSGRICGSNQNPELDRNVRELLNVVVTEIGGEVGGHKNAAGCMISQKDEEKFISLLKKNLEIETIKIS